MIMDHWLDIGVLIVVGWGFYAIYRGSGGGLRQLFVDLIVVPLFKRPDLRGPSRDDPAPPEEPSAQPPPPAAMHDDGTIEAAAIALARGWAGESTIIEELFHVRRGGGAAYTQIRDAVRGRALRYGYRPPRGDGHRTVTVTESGVRREVEL